MPVAEDLLGVRFDTQMLARLALSVAGVLLVSWAYRFYNSRRWHLRRDGPGSRQPNRTATLWEPDTGTSPEASADSPEEELLPPDELSPREAQCKPSPREPQNIPSTGEIQLVQHMHSPAERQNIQSVGETVSDQQEDSPGEAYNKPAPRETFSDQYDDSPAEPQNIQSVGEMVSDEHEDSPAEPQNIQSVGGTVSDQHEESPGEAHNILSSGEMFSDKSSSAEAQRSYLSNVEPDVAIVRGDENLNQDPNLPTEESVVQHDPPGIKRTPEAHDSRSQGALHTICEEAEGRLDADLVQDSSLSPSPLEDPDQAEVSPTGRLEPSISMCRELRQDLDHQGSSTNFLPKKDLGIEGEDCLLERDGDALVEEHARIYDYHMEPLVIPDESQQAGPSFPNPICELDDPAMSHDPQGLKEPEVSGTEAIHQGNSSNFLPKKDLGIEGEDFPLERDGDAPVDDPQGLKEPEVSGTEAIHPSNSSLTPPLSLQEHTGTDSLDPLPPGRQGLVRKDSYMQIVENADLQIPFHNPRASTPLSTLSSRTPSSEDLHSKPSSPVKDPAAFSGDTSEGMGQEGVEGLSISQVPIEGISSELDKLQGRLDLGNCLHALSLARKEGHGGLQRAALKVMADNYLQVLQDPGLYGSLKGGDRDEIRKLRTRGKRCLVVADLDPQDWSGSESSLPKTSSSLYYYDDHKDAWNFLCPLPKEVVSRGSAMCAMDNYLFVTLGCQGSGRDVQPSKRAFCYNPATSIWKEISPMNEARPQCKLVALGGCVYAIGGECLSSVERYDPRTGLWTFVAPMPNDTFAVAHRATTCNGELFVSGGTLRYTLLRYNPATNTWRRSQIVGTKERTVEMVAVKNFLYRFDVGSTGKVSVYRYHVSARLWYECCSRKLPHCSAFQCTTMDDVIYCVSRRTTMGFRADDVSPAFLTKDLSVLTEAKGILLPFILVLPEIETLQTRV
ncbi:kelch repeat and BTB domain-containing protein 11-like [Conger conger]|uniref:kelch repeat and BTB domain-containing protein 11-like n=1 Tax=Conger conger TaxID=82655 RepID=UPI002A59AEA5|nr:kelch repeat and BTB domain-containing protein 11-like [Conger conger]